VVAIPVTGNDTNCSPTTPCSVTNLTQPVSGTAVANSPATGQVTYTPIAGFSGTVTFTYTATNAAGTSNAATVTVTVTPNPVTDIATITSATRANNGRFSTTGLVSLFNGAFAPRVTVFQGAVSGTVCSGSNLGTANVSAKNGSWSFAIRRLPPSNNPRSVCVQSANGGVAVRPF